MIALNKKHIGFDRERKERIWTMNRGLVKEVTALEFAELVKKATPVLADFYATWCIPCKAMMPVIERLAEQFSGRAEFVKVNIEDSAGLAAQQGVRGVPTFLLIVNGHTVERIVGAIGEKAIADLLNAHIPGAKSSIQATAA